MPTAKKRMERLNEVLEILKQHGGKMTFGELYGTVALKYGIRKETLWDYLNALKASGKVIFPEIFPITSEDYVEIELLRT
jgi:hypothetical protein